MAPQYLEGTLAQLASLLEFGGKVAHRVAGGQHQGLHPMGALAAGQIGMARLVDTAAFFDFVEAMLKRVDQHLAALGIVQQVVLQIGITPHDPDIAEYLIQHTGRTAGAAFCAQLVERLPGLLAQQAYHDFPVGK